MFKIANVYTQHANIIYCKFKFIHPSRFYNIQVILSKNLTANIEQNDYLSNHSRRSTCCRLRSAFWSTKSGADPESADPCLFQTCSSASKGSTSSRPRIRNGSK